MDPLSVILPNDPTWSWTAPVMDQQQPGKEVAGNQKQKQKNSRNRRRRGKRSAIERKNTSAPQKVKKAGTTKSKAVLKHGKKRTSMKSLPPKLGEKSGERRSKNYHRRGKRNVGVGKATVPTETSKNHAAEASFTSAAPRKGATVAKSAKHGQEKSCKNAQNKKNTIVAAGDGDIGMEIDQIFQPFITL